MDDILTFIIDSTLSGCRLDKAISTLCPELSRTLIQNLIEEKDILVNDKNAKSSLKLKENDVVTVVVPSPENCDVAPEDIPLDIVLEDKDIIVINKPQGMVVHPANGHYSGTLVNALLYHCQDLSGINGVMRPGIVHRIDKDTSGLIVVAKNDNAHEKLAAQLKDKTCFRKYIALVQGEINHNQGTINAPIGRHPTKRKEMSVNFSGKNATTHFKVIERFNGFTLVECILETGRTHQIRVHMQYIKYPIVGDPLYYLNRRYDFLPGQLLHATELSFIHPTTNEKVVCKCDLPKHFEEVLNSLRTNGTLK